MILMTIILALILVSGPFLLHHQVLWAVLPALLLYLVLPREENCLLVLLQLETTQLSQREMETLGNIKSVTWSVLV